MTIFSGTGAPAAFSSASGGKVYGYNNISESAAIVVAPANPSRQKISFHNPGTVDIYIAPVNVQNVLGTSPTNPSDVALSLTNAALGGSRLVYGNGGTLDISGECQGSWQALAKTGGGTTNSLTVMDSNT
jgi:hypothetical protein